MQKKKTSEKKKKINKINLDDCQEQYKILFESSSDAIIALGKDNFLDCNEATLKMFGMTKKEFTRAYPFEISPPKQANGKSSRIEADKRIAEAFKKGVNKFEWIHRRSNGEDFPATVWLTVFPFDGEQVLQATVRDITEQKGIELALAESEARLRSIWDCIQTGIVIIDTETREIVDINNKALEMIGASKKKVIGRICHEFICPSEVGKCPILDRGQKADAMERILLTANGKELPIQKAATTFKLGDKKYILDSFVDISLQKNVEAQLEVHKEHLEDLVEDRTGQLVKAEKEVRRLIQAVETSINAVIILDIDMNIEYANLAFTELFEADMNMILKTNAGAYIEKDYLDQIRENIERGLEGIDVGAFEIQARTSKGNLRWLEIVGSIIYDNGGEPEGIMAIIMDITERKLAEREILKLKDFSKNVIDNSPVGILATDMRGNILTANHSLLEMLGNFDEENIKEFNVLNLENFVEQGFSEILGQCLDEGKIIKVESIVYRPLCGCGKKSIVSLNIVPLRDADEKQIGMVAHIEDITERNKAREALISSERIYRSLYESTIALADSTDLDEVISVIAEQARIMLNGEFSTIYLWDEFMQTLDPYYTNVEEDKEKLMKYKVKPGEGLTGIVAKKKKGAYVNYDEDKKNIRGHIPGTGTQTDHLQSVIAEPMIVEGQLVGIINVIAENRTFNKDDLSKMEILAHQATIAYMRSQSIDALTQSEGRFRRMAENIHDGLTIIENGNVVFINERACEIYGYSMEELKEMSVLDLIIQEDREQMRQIIKNAKKTDVILGELEFWIEQKDGGKRYVRTRTSTNKEAANTNVFIITTDITTRKLDEDEVKRKKMRFLLEDGRTYLVKEFRPDISIEAFKDLIDIDYSGIIISRSPKEDFHNSAIGPFEHVWLGQKIDEEKSLFDNLISRINEQQGKSVVLIDRLDYLIFKHGFRETLSFLYGLRDIVYLKEQVVILSIDPSTISEVELNLILKEMNEIEKRHISRPSEDLFEIIDIIYKKNNSGIKPSFSEIGAELGISKPTFRKRVRSLIANGYIMELTKGNKKILVLTQKGRSLFFQ
ncbi:MAG: PAS domain S-box protein [Thermoplasmata archaeon]|nr:PAS domain S-box protein [Thermoplasmata archaeon]